MNRRTLFAALAGALAALPFAGKAQEAETSAITYDLGQRWDGETLWQSSTFGESVPLHHEIVWEEGPDDWKYDYYDYFDGSYFETGWFDAATPSFEKIVKEQ